MSELDLWRGAIVSKIKRLQEDKVSRVGAMGSTRTCLHANGIQRGDRVRIKNKIKKPVSWPNTRLWREDEYRSAIVTKATPEQIFILTDNGVSNWRAPNNLKKILGLAAVPPRADLPSVPSPVLSLTPVEDKVEADAAEDEADAGKQRQVDCYKYGVQEQLQGSDRGNARQRVRVLRRTTRSPSVCKIYGALGDILQEEVPALPRPCPPLCGEHVRPG